MLRQFLLPYLLSLILSPNILLPTGVTRQIPTPSPGMVSFGFAGDISFGEGYANMNYYHSTGNDITKCIDAPLRERMASADVFMLNNEFTYGPGGSPLAGKTYTFQARPEMAFDLSSLGVDLVSLANNHAYDYGSDGLLSTFAALKSARIPYVGAGRSLAEASLPVCFLTNGMKFSIVAATQVERSYVFTKEATDTECGVLRTYDPSRFLQVIRKAQADSDVVIVYVHWGTEQEAFYEADQQALAHAYVEAGADLVVGCHPHCLQGIEYYNGVPIVYSLGNFWFNSRTIDTGILEADFNADGLSALRFLPCIQTGCRTSLLTDERERERVFRYMESISPGISITEEGLVLPDNGS